MKKLLILLLLALPLIGISQTTTEISNILAGQSLKATGNITTQNLNPLTGVPTAGSFVKLSLGNHTSVMILVSGTYTGVLSVQFSTDGGSTWITYTNGFSLLKEVDGTSSATIASASVGGWAISVGGLTDIRVSGLAAMTGTAVVTLKAVSGANVVSLGSALPTGANTIGAVTIGSGTVTTVSTVTAVTTLSNGQTAHSSASTGSPVRGAGRVLATSAATQDVTLVAGDAADLGISTGGQLVVVPFATAENTWQYPAATSGISNTTTAVTFKAASGTANIRNYISSIQVSAGTLGTATELAVRDGAAGTVLWRIFIPTTGMNSTFEILPAIKGTANTLLEVVTLTASGTGSVYFNAQGYTGF